MRLALPAVAACAVLSSLPRIAAPTANSPRGRPYGGPEEQTFTTHGEPDVNRPLAWLIAAQNGDGSWGADAHSQAPDVATTSLAGIALLRLGHTGTRGQFRANTRRAVEYVIAAVQRAPVEDIAIQAPGTLPQRKLGRNIDTFVAAQFLSEALPTLPRDLAGPAGAALANCVQRIERAQAADGSFAKDGWAPLLSSAFAANGLHAASAAGARVDAKKLARADANLMGKYDDRTKSFDIRESAGVPLYAAAASAIASARVREAKPGSPETTPEMRRQAKIVAAETGEQLANDRLLRGYGTYGGEEHVSYMMTAEAKSRASAVEFGEWSKQMRARLASIQREDGTWRGDHCITSTTFCTAASLITLAVQHHEGGQPS